MDGIDVEVLLHRLRESRLPAEERRASLETLRQALHPLIASSFTDLTLDPLIEAAIREAPSDVRRTVLQSISLHIEKEHSSINSDQHALKAVHALLGPIDDFLRSTLKIKSSKAVPLSATRSGADILSLSTSALRAIAAALKTLHALLRILPKQTKTPSPASSTGSKNASLSSLIDILLPCIFAGLQAARPATMTVPRSTSSVQAGAFSWKQPVRYSHPASTRDQQYNASRADDSSSGETDRKSDKSESEPSDISTTSTSSARSSKAESRQLETAKKLNRQNALYCLTELNRLESRSLITRWSHLLPDQPASNPFDKPTPPLVSRPLPSAVNSAPLSLCTLITNDSSTSVRLAAMSALESILSHGALQFSMAQERAQRALSFTSLSSQLAGWIVNIRSYLVVALQRAARAPSASGSGGEAVGIPSTLIIALLQLIRVFVVNTSKAKLVIANAAVLGQVVVPFVSHSDTEVQGAAKRVLGLLVPASNLTRTGLAKPLDSLPPAAGNPAVASSSAMCSGLETMVDFTALLSEKAELNASLCEQVLAAFEAANDPVQHLPTWSSFVKALADGPSDLLGTIECKRLLTIWQKLSTRTCKTSDQQNATLSSLPDLWKVLSQGSTVDGEMLPTILQYVKSCCENGDEAIRAAAVRVLGLLVLPSDTSSPSSDAASDGAEVQDSLREALWGADLLHDKSSLVRQRAAWAFSNVVEARLRSGTSPSAQQWISDAQYCLEAARDIEGVAVSACRASGSLLALLAPSASAEARSLAVKLIEQLCKVLGTTFKPPKSRWNAASAMERALRSDIVFRLLSEKGPLLNQSVELLCVNLDAKVFKIRVSSASALMSLLGGPKTAQSESGNATRQELLGEERCERINGFAAARLAELALPASQSKESSLYVDELQRLLTCLVTLSS
ncbi:hypothetical protein NDA11_003206 [Ustilago hordei]|uniref:DUF4042 domain-containing protein n=1 Tax=Ustilago hordei TaxID=120017 RepID=I2G1V5_USTHO|nr:uncharacterized protein UHO2_02344 [Ustilago hordei]KAJ1039987.1 hypothetical protein NDA10_002977 [Ustilago hordei]KAJ1592930.1 hypothetical protein NDA11_003206 [Ustilago hordei]CCF53148.1 uncharacterized protein UHOR_02951 [Ustilago hordei]SYW77536.1 uncharacterized protein UHO2_02344 [Ustilago hordei]